MSELLFAQVKRKLNITWEDEDTTAQIHEMIASAIPTMVHKLGIADESFDFSVAGQENTLFKNYCLYEWNHCVNEFDDNYKNEIAQVRAKHSVKHHQNNGGGEDAEE